MIPNILGQYKINVDPHQATYLLGLLAKVDVYKMTTGEYIDHAKIVSQLEEIENV